VLHTVPTLDRDDAFAAMGELSNELFNGPDAAEGMAAFAEKRLPSWSKATR
jgi:enoyl-CoA hydratase/carnithine racemase